MGSARSITNRAAIAALASGIRATMPIQFQGTVRPAFFRVRFGETCAIAIGALEGASRIVVYTALPSDYAHPNNFQRKHRRTDGLVSQKNADPANRIREWSTKTFRNVWKTVHAQPWV
jgi:hypothetical protein